MSQPLSAWLIAAAITASPFATAAAQQGETAEQPAQQTESTQPAAESVDAADGPAVEFDKSVVTATRTETSVRAVPMSISVLESEQIREQTAIDRDLGDILGKTTPGFSPSTEALSTFGQTLRGRDFLVLIDGVPTSTPLRGASRDLNTIDPDAIERMEILRGGTAIYGFGATGGLVNIISRKPDRTKPFSLYSEAGFGFSTEHFDDSIEWHTTHRATGYEDNFDYLFSGTFVQRGGRFDAEGDRIPPDPLGVQGGYDDSDAANVLGKFGFDLDGGRQRLELTVNHFTLRQDTDYTGVDPTAPGFGTGDYSEGEKTIAIPGDFNVEDPGTDNTTVSLNYTHNDVEGSTVAFQAYYQDLTATFAKFPGFTQTEVVADKIGSRLTIDTPLTVGDHELALIWGLDYLRDQTVQEGIDGPTIVPDMTQDALAGFAQLEVPIGDVALLRGGARHERFWLDVDDVVNRGGFLITGGDLDYDATLFNLGAVVYVTDEIDVFGGYSQGYSIGDIGRAIRDFGAATSVEALSPEAQEVDSYELGVRGDWGTFAGSLAGFYNQSDEGTTYDADLFLVRQPEEIYGVEATLEFRPHEAWLFGGTATWMEGMADTDDDGDYEAHLGGTRIPPLKLTAFVEHKTLAWWRNRLQLLYSGDRDHDDITGFDVGEVDNFIILDFYSAIDVGPGTLRVGVENLLNEEYFPVVNQAFASDYGYAMGSGRTVSLIYGFTW